MRFLLRLAFVVLVILAALAAFDRLLPERMAGVALTLQRRVAGLEAKRTQIPGFDIAYLEGGAGAPLVLVHGIGADKDNFDRVAMYLTRHYRVIAIDLPGFGESSQPAGADYGIAAQTQRLGQILDALQLGAVHLGGSSMGGWIIGTFAADHPERVQSLWLLGAAGLSGVKLGEVRRAYRESGQYLLFARTPEEYERIIDTVFFARPYLPYSVRHVLGQRAIRNYELHTSIFRTLDEQWERTALDARLPAVNAPTLVVFGDHDRAIDPSAGLRFAELLPHARLIVMQDIGHLPMLEAPGRAARDYLEFRTALEPVTR